MYKKINYIIFLILSLFILLTVILQSSLQHWSGQWDLDFWYIYNASLMASGIEQEWFDHPATSILAIYSFFYKIYSLVDSSFVYKIDEIINSSNPNLILQKIYFVTRIIDSINVILIILFAFKISKILSLKDLYAYFLILTLLISKTFLNNLSILNPEDWAILFFLISFYYFIKFFIEKKTLFLLLSGSFFAFSFFSKISILFLFIFTIALIPLFFQIYSKENNDKIIKFFEKYFYLTFIIYLLLLIFYFAIQFIVFSNLAPFEKNAGLDPIIIFIINFFYMMFFLIISKFDIIKFRTYFSLFLIFFLGFFISLIIFLFIDLLNIAKFNPWVLFHLSNPFNEMIRFIAINSSTSLSVNALDVIQVLFSKFLFDKILFIGLCFIFVISIFKDLKNKDIYYFLFKLIIFFSFLFNVLIFNFRFYIEYALFAHILYIILLSVCFKNLSNRIINFFCFISFIYIVAFLPVKNFDYLKSILSTRSSKLEMLCNENYSEFKIYSKKFNSDTYRKICN